MSTNTLKDVYVTAAGSFLPNEPVTNDDIEEVLGYVGGQPSRYKKHVLAANGIKQRHYARTKSGLQTHLNEEMAANAVLAALKDRGMSLDELQMLATATTIADTLMPGFGPMVHGRLGGVPMDVLTTSGICSASMTAMKSAWLAIRAGQHNNAMTVGSELPSAVMKAARFERESVIDELRETDNDSYKYFNADFLRWMLSDGAGAVLMEDRPRPGGLSLRVDWIEYKSYANALPACLYLGTKKTSQLSVGDTFNSYATFAEAEKDGLFVLRQDTQLLPIGLLKSVVEEAKCLRARGMLIPDEVDHFLPHLSSYFFLDRYNDVLEKADVNIPKEKWFTNLETKGNTGAASIFIILEEAMRSGRFKPGDRIVTMVPESGRFSVSYAHFTCVGD